MKWANFNELQNWSSPKSEFQLASPVLPIPVPKKINSKQSEEESLYNYDITYMAKDHPLLQGDHREVLCFIYSSQAQVFQCV